ncbi:MAG TPA: AAA family ATPase [Patescibacteria group bacterium]|nr:AAA family ATPase [Patescibacteria group bacterium]
MIADVRNIYLAIGGPSGAGKTTLIEELKHSPIGHRIRTHIAYTTRPKRGKEVNGVHYFFVEHENLPKYQADPRYIHFVKARENWYWHDSAELSNLQNQDGSIHIFTVTQAKEFLEKQRSIPELKWVWLYAEEDVLRQRLERRGDVDVEKSLEHNKRLIDQSKSSLVSMFLKTKTHSISDSLQQVLQFIRTLEQTMKID